MKIKEKVCDFANLHKAAWICSKNVKWKDSVTGALMHGMQNTHVLKRELDLGTYKISPYTTFKVYEPKEREIVATKFRDRVFQRSLSDHYLYDEITKRFVYDNHACQINRGTDQARKRLPVHLQKFYRKHKTSGYILKCDLKNYFGSTSHVVAKETMRKHIGNEWAYHHVEKIIESFPGDHGIGLGSQISQLIQLAMLNELDHIVKEQLKIKHYVRYMDDFVLIHQDKTHLKHCKEIIEKWLVGKELKLNNQKTQITPVTKPIKWLGFNFVLKPTGKIIKTLPKSRIKHEKRKLRKQVKLCKTGKITKDQLENCFVAWKAHASKGNTHHAVKNMENYFKKLKEMEDV